MEDLLKYKRSAYYSKRYGFYCMCIAGSRYEMGTYSPVFMYGIFLPGHRYGRGQRGWGCYLGHFNGANVKAGSSGTGWLLVMLLEFLTGFCAVGAKKFRHLLVFV